MCIMELMSARDVLAYLPVSREHLYDLAREGVIPSIKIGGKLLFKRSDIEHIEQYGTTHSIEEEVAHI